MKSSESGFPIPKAPLRWRWRIAIGAVCLGVWVCAFAWDGDVIARVDAYRQALGDVTERRISHFLHGIEYYAMGYITAAIAVAMLFLDRRRPARAIALGVIVITVGIGNNILKQSFGRARPITYWKMHNDSGGLAGSGGSKSLPSLQLHLGGPAKGFGLGQSKFQSFPSGHSAAAAAQSAVLSAFYPQGTAVFLVLTALVGAERIYHEDHYPSDVWGGLLFGWFLARALLAWRGMQRLCVWLAGLPPLRWITGANCGRDGRDGTNRRDINGHKDLPMT